MVGLRSKREVATARRAVVASVILSFAVLWVTSGSPGAFAQDEALVGNWQVDIDCGVFPFEYATATSFLLIEADPEAGGLIATQPRCGTLAVPGSIQELVECVGDPDGVPVLFGGRVVKIPPDGSVVSVSSPESPFPFPLLNCAEVDVITTSLNYLGVTDIDEDGTVVRIRGSLMNDQVRLQDSAGQTCFELLSSYSCDFEMRRNDVHPGQSVTVEPRAGARITFAEVLTPGTASVVPLTELASRLPPGFQVVGDAVHVVFDVSTSAQFTGPVDLCVSYPDQDGDGFVDETDPPVREERVRLLHEEGDVFVDRTVGLDAARNEVCGRTASLSQFAVGGAEPVPSPGFRRIAPWRNGSRGRVPTRSFAGSGRSLVPAR